MAGDTHEFEPSPDRSRDLRDAFGCFGTGVTIVTARTPTGPLGMTANSFSSVSLDPPLVLWCPSRKSQRHDAFVEAQAFCIHVLSSEQRDMAQHFATKGTDFAEFSWHEGPLGAPVLPGCLAEFHCKTHAIHAAGDHSIIVGEVFRVAHHQRGFAGLIFEKGRFGSVTLL